MKTLITILICLSALCSFSQNEGVITYESTVQTDLSRMPEQFRDRMPKERKSEKQLRFTKIESHYKHLRNIVDMDRETGFSGGNRGGQGGRGRGGSGGGMFGGAGGGEFYTNSAEALTVNKIDFFGRTFLIENEEKLQWKVTGESAAIAGYQCMKAVTQKDTASIVAWFTPQIPISLGPGEYIGLPGMILKVDIDEGQTVLTATNVDLRSLTEEEAIARPGKGKKISREAFDKVRKEKMAEMDDMRRSFMGGGGRRGN